MKTIKVLYHGSFQEIELIDGKSDWYDLRAEDVSLVEIRNGISEQHRVDGGVDKYLTRSSRAYPITVEEGIYFDKNNQQESVRYFPYEQGDYLKINLGVSMKLPEGYEAYIVPRGSTFKNHGLIQPNSPGVVDESYNGNDDIWFMPAYALEDGFIIKGDRICQFRIQKKMKPVEFKTVKELSKKNRGAHGSTGTR